MASWTVVIDSISRKFKKVPDFERRLKNDTPTEIRELLIEYDQANPIDFWDVIEIKRDGITEWKGFVETREIVWDDDGRYYQIGGRDSSVILWKKFNENFSNMQEGTEGFFGRVSASELIKLLLRCPKSDLGADYPFNKSGWGIDSSKITSAFSFYANPTTQIATGDPMWVFLRKRGLGWKNSGTVKTTQLDVNLAGTIQWTTFGSTPYLDTEDDINYIHSDPVVGEYCTFRLENLASNATALKQVSLDILWKPDSSFWGWGEYGIQANSSVYISKNGGSTWTFVGNFHGRLNPFISYPWWHYTFSIPVTFFESMDELRNNNLWIKFINNSADLSTNITHAYLNVVYEEAGTQALGDEFDIRFTTETLCGLYMESRADNTSFARNWGIVNVTDVPQNYTTYQETDPNNHITKTSTHIDFDAYQNEDAYVYKDFGEGYFDGYFQHQFTVKIVTDPTPASAVFCVWAVANDIDDYIGLGTGVRDNLCLTIQQLGGAGPVFVLVERNGGISQTVYAGSGYYNLTEGATYTVIIKRIGGLVRVYIIEGGFVFQILTMNMNGPSHTFRYLYGCNTANNGSAIHTNIDLDNLSIETYESLGFVNNNTYRDIIASWSPRSMNHLRIRITSSASFAWGITQIYLYKAEDLDYRVWYEGGTTPSYPLNQYIQSVSIDSTYTPAIGPLNIAEGRLLNTIYSFVQKLNESYVPFDVWMAMDANNTLHIKNQRGTNKSGSVNFQLALNLEGNKYMQTIQDTVQRVKVNASGEGQESDLNSSDWVTNIPASVKSWYEEIISEKDIADKTIANMIAQIYLSVNKNIASQIILKVSNDVYTTLTYDVGDTVTITDSLIGVTSTSRIYNISKDIDSNGEHVIIHCGAPKINIEDTWAEIYERLKVLERVGVVKPDWTADGINNRKIDPNQMETMFEATGHNDEVDTGSNADVQWYMRYSGYGGGRGRVSTPSYGMQLQIDKDNGVVKGPNSGASTYYIMSERRYDDVNDGVDLFHDIPLSQSPKMAIEVKIYEVTGGTPQFWNEGDTFDFGFKKWADNTSYPLRGSGYWFRIVAGGSSEFHVLAVWADANYNETIKYITTLTNNKKYRYEIISDAKKKQVLFEVYDVENSPELPYSAIRLGVELSQIVRPFHACMVANHNNQYVAQVYLYRLKIEYKKAGT